MLSIVSFQGDRKDCRARFSGTDGMLIANQFIEESLSAYYGWGEYIEQRRGLSVKNVSFVCRFFLASFLLVQFMLFI